MSVGELLRRGQEGWPRRYPVAYLPNAPLLIAFAGWGLGRVAEGAAHDAGRAVFTIGFGIWAWEEAADGENLFRRALGVAGLVWIVAELAGEL